jgi:magnesium-transporting ATPase (P-type)
MLHGLQRSGTVLLERTKSTLEFMEHDELKTLQIAECLDFSSDRRRMSLIVENADGSRELYSKGADAVILGLLKGEASETAAAAELAATVDGFAAAGLRTLSCAFKSLTDEEYSRFRAAHQAASLSLENRDEQAATA